MSDHVVAADFKSVNRRFKAGDDVVPSDIDPGSHYSFDDWKGLGFIKKKDDEPAPSSRAGWAPKSEPQDAEA